MKSFKTILIFGAALVIFGGLWAAKPKGKASKKPEVKLERVFGHTFEMPLLVLPFPGTKQYAVFEKGGRILLVREGKKEVLVLLDWQKKICSDGYEEGLLGGAFDPDFQKTGRLYLYYSTCNPRASVISRVVVTPASQRRARAGMQKTPSRIKPAQNAPAKLDFFLQEEILLTIKQPYSNHNGGNLVFGPDGYLYIGTGDGGLYGDPGNRSQDVTTLLGKILRIDVSTKKGYRIPDDNPLSSYTKRYEKVKKAREIYAWGMRNPWRFSFDSKTGLLWVADVGQNSYEEVAIVRKGENHGWRRLEGFHCYSPPVACDDPSLVKPVHTYGRDEGQSITGGYVYRGKKIKKLYGRYVFGDFLSGNIWALGPEIERSTGKNHPSELLLKSDLSISSFGVDRRGEILVVDFGGVIYRLAPG